MCLGLPLFCRLCSILPDAVIIVYIFFVQDCCLIVYHPYRPLLQYVQDMGQEDMLLPLAWCGTFCSPT